MRRLLVGVLALAALTGALAAAYAAGVPLSRVLGAAAGVLSLMWLILLVTVPWNLYFRARAVLAEIELSREKGLTVSEARDHEVARIARLMLYAAGAGHVLTAGLVALVTVATGNETGYWFAAFVLLSMFFRPAAAYFGQLRRRLRVLLRDVTYPRDDVMELSGRVEDLERGAHLQEGKAAEQYHALAQLRRTMDALSASVYARADEADRKIAALGREFEAAVDRLTDNEEIITGVKAFLRLLRSEGSAPA